MHYVIQCNARKNSTKSLLLRKIYVPKINTKYYRPSMILSKNNSDLQVHSMFYRFITKNTNEI